jgi:hypothetical protein
MGGVFSPAREAGALDGFADWAFLRVKQRLESGAKNDGDYFITTWLQVQAPFRAGCGAPGRCYKLRRPRA